MSGYTKGPYTLEDRGINTGVDILAVVPDWSTQPIRIASVVPFKNRLETATLFQAAPDLLEALKAIYAGVVSAGRVMDEEERVNINTTLKAFKALEAAIAKAEGK
jgi:hypothetical protein